MKIQPMMKKQLNTQIDVSSAEIKKLRVSRDRYKEEENAAQTAEDSFRPFLDTLPIGISLTNTEGNVFNANKAILNLLGYTLEDFKVKNVLDLYVDPADRQRLTDILLESNHVRNFETKLKKKDGTIVTVLINSDYMDIDGQKTLVTSIQDITLLTQIQKDFKGSEQQYHLIFTHAPIGISVTDFQGRIIVSNQAIEDLMGYSAKELTSINILDFYLDRSERQRLLDLSMKSGTVRDFETKYKRKDGKIISVLINTDLIEFRGQPNMLLTSIRDITNLKQIEEELVIERDFTNAVLDTAASLMLVIDREGRITRFNRACEKITGFTFQEVKDQYLWDIVSEDREVVIKTCKQLFAGNYPSIHENYLRTKSGDKRLISWSSTALLGDENKPEFIVATGIDITEHRRAETELQEANQKLLKWISELEQRSMEMNQLSEMGEQLQSCQSIEEACAIGSQYIQRICPASHGALYLINPSRDYAEALEMWGDPVYTEKMFTPLKCWAVRRSRPHRVDESHSGLLCEHITGPTTGQYLCVPMIAQGETIGILHLNHTESQQDEQKLMSTLCTENKIQLVTTIAEHIAMALSNLKLRETMRQQSIRDILTGLFNRRYMEETLTRELHRAEREKKPVGVIMFDIDHFKDFNDLVGHDGGDALLRELGAFLIKNIRGGDIVCRYGGEEFTAVLPGATAEETRMRAEAIRKGVKELLVYHMGKPLGKCTISLGVAAFPEHGLSGEEILKRADSALYTAKNQGRDQVVVAPV